MKTISIKSLDLLNFKGTKKAHYEFSEECWVGGDNGTGKTTIMDAFTWCMFGKDSKGKTDKDFDLKTLDENGEVIWKLPHEVIAVLSVNGETTTFRRCFCEKWVKQRGSIVETFEGHETKYYVNDVPRSMKDYKAKVADIIDEDVFRMVTCPTHFLSLKKDVQRNILLSMYGDIDDNEIAKENAAFIELMGKLTGKDIDEYKEQLKAQLATIKKNCEYIPVQIEERQRSLAETPAEDWIGLETELSQLKDKASDIQEQMASHAAKIDAASEKQKDYNDRLIQCRQDIMAKEAEIKNKMLAEYYEAKNAKTRIQHDIQAEEINADNSKNSLDIIFKDIKNYEAQEEEYKKKLADVEKQKYEPIENDYRCPTCGRFYEANQQNDRYAELLGKFNARKAENIKNLKEQLQFFASRKKELEEQATNIRNSAIKTNSKLDSLRMKLLQYVDLPETAPDVSNQVANSESIKNLKEVEASILEKIKMFTAPAETGENPLKDAWAEVQEKINDCRQKLMKKDILLRDNKRIEELTQELQHNAAEMAELEGELQTIYEFKKAKVEAIEGRINEQFDIVNFRLFKMQINGGEQEDCEALVGGVPYSRSLNNAARINAGLDIINAMSRHYNVSAPVFIDNAEASNHFIMMNCQRIFLKVTNDKDITFSM